MAMEQPHLALGEGERVSLRGAEVVFKAAGKRAGGGPTVLEFSTEPGFATGDHVHRTIEEIFCVLDGEFAIRAGDRTEQVRSGGLVRVPPGMVHGFANPGSAPATLMLIISPAGVHEEYFRELAAILAQPGPPDTAAIGALRARYDTEQISALTAS